MMVKLNSLCCLFGIQRHLNGVPCMKNEDKKVVIKDCIHKNIGLKTTYTKNQLVSLPNNKI